VAAERYQLKLQLIARIYNLINSCSYPTLIYRSQLTHAAHITHNRPVFQSQISGNELRAFGRGPEYSRGNCSCPTLSSDRLGRLNNRGSHFRHLREQGYIAARHLNHSNQSEYPMQVFALELGKHCRICVHAIRLSVCRLDYVKKHSKSSCVKRLWSKNVESEVVT
jgi:hypothetical protein